MGVPKREFDLTNPAPETNQVSRKKRSRAVVVCVLCRKRKIKCDKKHPCSNCVKVNQAHNCSYDSTAVREPSDDFKIEMRLPINQQVPEQQASEKAYCGQFAVKTNHTVSQRTENKPTVKNASPEPPKTLANGSGYNSELEMLKERLQMIEQSLVSSAPRPNIPPITRNSSTNQNQQIQPLLHQPSFIQSPQNFFRSTPNSHGVSFPPQTPVIPPVYQHQLPQILPSAHTHSGEEAPHLPQVANHGMRLPEIDSMSGQRGNPHSMNSPRWPISSMHNPLPKGERSSPGEIREPSEIDTQNGSTTSESAALHSTSESVASSLSLPYSQSFATGGFDSAQSFLIGVNIFASANDTINFYEKYSSVHVKDNLRRLNFGPFAWSSLMKRDMALRMVLDHIASQREKESSKDEPAALLFARPKNEITQEDTDTLLTDDKLSGVNGVENQFKKRALQTDGYEELIPYKNIIDARNNKNLQKVIVNKSTLPLGLTFYDGQIDRELQLIEKILVVLPKRKVLWKLVSRFFDWVYPYMPFLDEDYFRADVEKIFGSMKYVDEPITDIKIEKKLDLATVGILLIVLRLAYLSLFSNNSSLNEEILNNPSPSLDEMIAQYLMRNPININTIDIASLCLDQFQLLRRSNFTVLQLALYLRIYHTYAPEDGDGADGGDAQVLNSVLIQTAYSLGLNREPDEQCTDLKINNLSRKIWYYLHLVDMHQAYSFGNPMVSDSMYYDTKPPFHEFGGENLRDTLKDKEITLRLNNCSFLQPRLSKILKLTLQVQGRTKVPELCQLLSEFELDWYNRGGTLKECIICNSNDDAEVADRNYRTKVYLATKSFLLSIYFHMYLHYEETNMDISFFYLKKCLLTSIGDIMPHYVTLLGESEVMTDMIINPTLEMTIHKSNQINLSAIVRVNFVIFHMRQSPDHERFCKDDKEYLAYFQMLCQLSSSLTRAAEFTISAINKLSNRYYYAWRISRGQTHLLKTITSTNYYQQNYHKATHICSRRFTAAQLTELIQICVFTLDKYKRTEFCTYGFTKHMDKNLYTCNDPSPSESSKSDTPHQSSGSSNPADKITNNEIDKLWLSVLSLKHDKSLAGERHDGPLDAKSISRPNMGSHVGDLENTNLTNGDLAGTTPSNFNHFGYDIEMASKFDFLSEMPFDQMFDF